MDFQLKIGVITQSRGPINSQKSRLSTFQNTFQVRVLPDMEDMIEDDLLPWYPCFFSDQQSAYTPGEKVWVLVNTTEYLVGYILGRASPPAGDSVLEPISFINQIEEELKIEKSSYESLSLDAVTPYIIQFRNIHTGLTGALYNTRTYWVVTPGGDIFIKNPGIQGKIDFQGNISLLGNSCTEIYRQEQKTQTSALEEISVSKTVEVQNLSKESVGGSKQTSVGGDSILLIGGEENTVIGKKKKEIIGLGEERRIVTGGSFTQILTGPYALTIGAGNVSVTTGAGAISLTSTGALTLTSTSTIIITAPIVEVRAPIFKAPQGTVAPTGGGPFCALPFCLFTGAPHQGNIHTGGG